MSEMSQQAVRVKLCGMTRPQDAALASALGADAIGMIFYRESARNVSLQTARQIAAVVSPLCTMIAVVVNPTKKELDTILNTVPIHAIQFHGDEPAGFCESFGRPYIKAVRMQPGICLSQQQAQYASASALLLDAHDKKLVGGTGQTFDWSMLDTTTIQDQARPGLILAGGLSPDNAEQALVQTGVRHLDVNSGIEVAPGVKDHDKMRAIMQIKTNHTL